MTYVVLWVNQQGSMSSATYSDIDLAYEKLEELTENSSNKNARLLTDVVESHTDYKELYMQLYNDFVKPHSKQQIEEDTSEYRTIHKASVKD